MRLRHACAALCVATLTANVASASDMRWQHLPGVTNAGFQGIVTGDLDGDGRDEAVFSALLSNETSALGVIGRDGSELALEQMLAVDGTLAAPIIIGRSGNSARILALVQRGYYYEHALIEYGGRPLRELRSLPMAIWTQPLAIADLDADGDLDVLARQSDYYYYDATLTILDYATGTTLWTDTTASAGGIAAQLDSDAALELVVPGSPGRVLDGATRLQEWSYPAGFHPMLFAGEFDGGAATRELVAMAEYSGPVTLFRTSPYSPLREMQIENFDSGFAASDDIDGDGRDELLVPGYGSEGFIAYTPSTGIRRTFPHEGFYPTRGAAADLDGTSAAELVLASEQSYFDIPDAVRVLDTSSGLLRLSIAQASGPYAALALGDIDANGTNEVLHSVVQADELYGHYRSMCALDALSGERLSCLSRQGYYNYETLTAAPVFGRFNTSAGADIVVLRGALVTAYDGATFEEQWARSDIASDYQPMIAGAKMRFDADNIDDVVLLGGNGQLHVLDGRTGATLWQSVTLGSGGSGEMTLTVVNVDGDDAIEILVTTGNALYAFDSQTRLLDWSLSPELNIGRLVTWGSAAACRLGLYEVDGTFRTYRCNDRSIVGDDRTFPVNANMLRVLDPAGRHFVAASAGSLLTVAQDDSVREWASGLGSRLGHDNAGVVIPMGGSRYDVVVGSDAMVARIGIHLDLVFSDAFE